LRSLRGETVKGLEEIARIPLTGLLRYREASSTPLQSRDGRIIGAIAAVRDITDRKRAEMALRESEARYRELSEHLEQKVKEKVVELQQAETLAAMGRMVSVVAHEVRNPLQKIRMGVELLNAELTRDPDNLEILEDINDGVHTLNGIVGELLNYARPIGLELAAVRVEDLVQRALGLVKEKLANISLQTKLDDKEILADGPKLVQVLVNLLTNSADAMPNGGTLTLSSSFSEDNIFILSISDTGCGIEEQNLPKVFQPFFTTKTKGTGLGLAISKKIIEAHHGSLQLYGKIGEGTTAEISLPGCR
jgi:signal transduction histidine kinase